MLAELAFNLLLRSNAGVAAIVIDRIYASRAPQTPTYPLVLHRTEAIEDPSEVMEGSAGLAERRIRVYCAAADYQTAKVLDDAVKAAAHGFHGVISDDGSPEDTIALQRVWRVFTADDYDDKTQKHQVVSDYLVTAEEPV